MNVKGRIAFCGALTSYAGVPNPLDSTDLGPRFNALFILKQLKAEGFTVRAYQSEFLNAIKEEIQWIKEGKIKVLEQKEKGFENIPKTFVKIFTGENIGKAFVEI